MTLELWLLTGVYGLAALALVVAVAACVTARETERLHRSIVGVVRVAYAGGVKARADGCTCGWGWPRRATAADTEKGRHMRRCPHYQRQTRVGVVE